MENKIKEYKTPLELRFTAIFSMLIVLLISFSWVTQTLLTINSSWSFTSSITNISDASNYIIDYFGKLCSFIPFLFVIGATLNFKNKPTSYYFKRGIIIFAIASAAQLTYGISAALIVSSVFPESGGLAYLHIAFSANFLHTIAFCYLIFGILRAVKLRGILLRIVVLVVAAIFCFVKESSLIFDSPYNILDQVVGFFLPSAGQSEFPLFAWFIIFALGYIFGYALREIKNKKLFYIIAIIVGVIACVVVLCVSSNDEQTMYTILTNGVLSYYWISPVDAISSCIIAAGIVGIFYFITKALPEKIIKPINKQYDVLFAAYIFQMYLFLIIAIIKITAFDSTSYTNVLEYWLLFILFLVLLVVILNIYRVYIKNKLKPFFNKFWIPICICVIVIPIILFICADNIEDYVPSLVNGYDYFDSSR